MRLFVHDSAHVVDVMRWPKAVIVHGVGVPVESWDELDELLRRYGDPAFAPGQGRTVESSRLARGHGADLSPSDRALLRQFVKAGAPEEILYVSKPHIGTFRLVGMVETMRHEIESLGGEIRFQQRVTDVMIEDGPDGKRIGGVVLASGEVLRSHHVVLALDIVETYRDLVAGLTDVYLSSIDLRTQEVMKVLTVIATIFMPISFIASLYGMNLQIPETKWPWAYPAVLALMAVVVFGMLVWFRRKGWLGRTDRR